MNPPRDEEAEAARAEAVRREAERARVSAHVRRVVDAARVLDDAGLAALEARSGARRLRHVRGVTDDLDVHVYEDEKTLERRVLPTKVIRSLGLDAAFELAGDAGVRPRNPE